MRSIPINLTGGMTVFFHFSHESGESRPEPQKGYSTSEGMDTDFVLHDFDLSPLCCESPEQSKTATELGAVRDCTLWE